jgi:hypothetical protein
MATIGVVSSALSDHEHQVQLRRAVIASTIGTAIEWYDFFLYEHADHGPTVSLTPRITPHTREHVVEDLRCGPKAVAKKASTDLDLQSAAALVRCVRS